MGSCWSASQKIKSEAVIECQPHNGEAYVGEDISVHKLTLAKRYALPVHDVLLILGHCDGIKSADCICFAHCLTGYAMDLARKISTDSQFDKPTIMRRALAKVATSAYTMENWRSWKKAVLSLEDAEIRATVDFITSLSEEDLLNKKDHDLRERMEQQFTYLFVPHITAKSKDDVQAYFGVKGLHGQALLDISNPAFVAPMLRTPVLEQARRRAIFNLLVE